MPKKRLITFKVNHEQGLQYEKQAEKRNLNISKYIRFLLDENGKTQNKTKGSYHHVRGFTTRGI